MMTETLGLTMEEYGQYTVLLDLIFVHNGAIPDDPAFVRGPLKTNAAGWRRVRDKLLGLGRIYTVDGHIRSARADREIKQAKRQSDKAAVAGEISAAKRAMKGRSPQTLPQTSAYVSPKFSEKAPDINGSVQRPFNHPGPGPDIREEEAAPPPPLENGVVAEEKRLSEEVKIVVSPYLAQQIQGRSKWHQ